MYLLSCFHELVDPRHSRYLPQIVDIAGREHVDRNDWNEVNQEPGLQVGEWYLSLREDQDVKTIVVGAQEAEDDIQEENDIHEALKDDPARVRLVEEGDSERRENRLNPNNSINKIRPTPPWINSI